MRAGTWLLGIGSMSLLSSCDFDPDHTQTHLVADYVVVTDYEGYSCLHFQKHFWNEAVPLVPLDSAAVVGAYLATCMGEQGRYYFLPLHPDSKEAIDKQTIGPLSQSDYRLKINELGAGSAFRLSRIN